MLPALIVLGALLGFVVPAHAADISDGGYTYLCAWQATCTAPYAGHARLGENANYITSGRPLAAGEQFQCYIYNDIFGQNMPAVPSGDPVYCYFEPQGGGTGGTSPGPVSMDWSNSSHLGQALCVGIGVLLLALGYRAGDRV